MLINVFCDRRNYKRYNIHKEVNIYFNGIDEDVAMMLNISECGCCFCTSKDFYRLGEVCTVVLCDYSISGEDLIEQFNYRIKRILKTEDGYQIGCSIIDPAQCTKYIQLLECKERMGIDL